MVFSGIVSFVDDKEEKLIVLRKQIDKQSGDKGAMKNRLEAMAAKAHALFTNTLSWRIRIESITGKRSTLWTEEKLHELK